MLHTRNNFISLGHHWPEKRSKRISSPVDSCHDPGHFCRYHTFYLCRDLWQSEVCSVDGNALHYRLFHVMFECKHKIKEESSETGFSFSILIFLQMYCLVCIVSQYQEYKIGRGLTASHYVIVSLFLNERFLHSHQSS